MNKKVLLLTALFLGSLSSVFAQEESSQDLIIDEVTYGKPNQTYNTYKTTWKKNRFKDNWTITVGGGVQTIFGEDDSKADFQNRLTFAPTVSIAKYFSPIWGLRLNFSGGSLHGFNDGNGGVYRKWNHGDKNYMGKGFASNNNKPWEMAPNSAYPNAVGTEMFTWDPQWSYMGFTLDENAPRNKRILYDSNNHTYRWAGGDDGLLYMQHIRYFQANIDFMFDFFNLIGNYNDKRFFELSPFGGIGVYNAFSNLGSDNYLTVGAHAGLIAKFRITDRIGIHTEFSASVVGDDFDGQSGDGQNMTGIAQATMGIAYKLGKTNWQVAEPIDYGLINDLINQINDLQNRPEKICPVCPPPPPVVEEVKKEEPAEIKFLPDPVFFKLNKSVIDNGEWPAIEKAANYLMSHPDDNVVVTGYADKGTGSPNYNLKLSEKRSKAVSQALIEQYGINPLRISVNWSGSKIQPFKINEWNRVVIFVIE